MLSTIVTVDLLWVSNSAMAVASDPLGISNVEAGAWAKTAAGRRVRIRRNDTRLVGQESRLHVALIRNRDTRHIRAYFGFPAATVPERRHAG
jgi:hypothetical protein